MGADVLFTVIVGVCGITGSLIMLLSAVAMFRTHDALSRVNVFSPASGVGMPLILVAAYAYTLWHDGFSLKKLCMAIIAFFALIIVSSVASNTLSRATFASGSPVWRKTEPNRLAQPRDPAQDAEALAQAERAEAEVLTAEELADYEDAQAQADAMDAGDQTRERLAAARHHAAEVRARRGFGPQFGDEAARWRSGRRRARQAAEAAEATGGARAAHDDPAGHYDEDIDPNSSDGFDDARG
ncbi:monovalent cation/H(+) antiporter subunit G [Brevibacterium sp. BRM-1]|uniref:cation:proton antiporter n=1 Tax=Brevibacterium sp. BRM-1 TaxID=2999062 RepID=UPI00227FD5F6|nr:monovalent cation/H(+) antiporter subunit G [Brevibacterium sp. BRM-1]WAL40618.1 monovalent cation/H(+) antiporter subunit G [Brevibacterium sp. BRM-1]